MVLSETAEHRLKANDAQNLHNVINCFFFIFPWAVARRQKILTVSVLGELRNNREKKTRVGYSDSRRI